MSGKFLGALLVLAALTDPVHGEAMKPMVEPFAETAQIVSGESYRFPLSIAPGSYVIGHLDSGKIPVDLSLISETGAPIRRLLDASTGNAGFQFVVPDGAAGMLARGQESGPVTLMIDRVLEQEALTGMPPAPLLSPTMATLSDHLAQGGTTGAFWQDRMREGTPMIEPSGHEGHVIVTFLWRGAEKNVRLWGAPASDHVWMTRLGDSDVWFASFEVPDSLRLTYGIAPDVPQFAGTARENRVALLATLQADPLNRYPIYPEASDIWAQRSELSLPNAPDQPGMTGVLPAARGAISSFDFTSEALGNTRRVDVYMPAGFDPSDPETVLLVLFDGPAYQTPRAPVPEILDRLIAAGELPPVVAVLIDPLDSETRRRELPLNPAFLAAVSDEILPHVSRDLGLPLSPARTVVAGSSYGGLASAWFVHERPEVFGNAIILSGSFWWAPEGDAGQGAPYMSRLWMEDAPRDVRLWMSAGLYEAARLPGEVSILETSRHLRDILTMAGVDLSYREYAGGHDYLIWRGALAEGLLNLFGTAPP
jgi:Enterochelin esterase and related enzymes